MDEKSERKPYDVEPEKPRKGSIERESLTEGFDEDADFDHDPEVAAALGAKTARKAAPEPDAPHGLVRPGMGPWRFWAGVGCALLLSATVLATLSFGDGTETFRDKAFAHGLLVIYNGLLQTGTGVAAVFVAALILEKPFGSVELAAGRMFAAIAAFLAVYHAPIDVVSTGKLEEVVLASLAYLGVVALTFRPGRVALAIIAGAHFMLWLIVQLGMELSRWTVSAGGS